MANGEKRERINVKDKKENMIESIQNEWIEEHVNDRYCGEYILRKGKT